MTREKDFTVGVVVLTIVLTVVMTQANLYLALYAGMTVSASIPAAVLAALVLRRRGLHQKNIVQTGASAGEALAAGVAFTISALVLKEIWPSFHFWPTALVAISGGVIGVLFMVPLRRSFIVESPELAYPEGQACASVLEATEKGASGSRYILGGGIVGAVFKFFLQGVIIFKGTVESAASVSLGKLKTVFYGGTDISMALLGVGVIIGPRIAAMVFLGGALAWIWAIPIYAFYHPELWVNPETGETLASLDIAWTIWDSQIRYLGVGAMLVGGLWAIFQVAGKIRLALRQAIASFRQKQNGEREDISGRTLLVLLGVVGIVVLTLYLWQAPTWESALASWVVMLGTAFFFVAVSVYICGLVGSTNNPVSGMIICTLLLASVVLLLFGATGTEGTLSALIIAGVVCCAAALGGDTSQDLKTGHLIGASPRNQQRIQLISVLVAAVVIPPTLNLLHRAYVIGEGLKAPQANMFGSLAEMFFQPGSEIPWLMMILGAVIGIVIILVDQFLKAYGTNFRLHPMPVAVGIYLPFSLAVPMLVGGIVRAVVDRKKGHPAERSDPGKLFAAGLIAGEALMGILLAVPIGLGWQGWAVYPSAVLSLFFMAGAVYTLYRVAMNQD